MMSNNDGRRKDNDNEGSDIFNVYYKNIPKQNKFCFKKVLEGSQDTHGLSTSTTAVKPNTLLPHVDEKQLNKQNLRLNSQKLQAKKFELTNLQSRNVSVSDSSKIKTNITSQKILPLKCDLKPLAYNKKDDVQLEIKGKNVKPFLKLSTNENLRKEKSYSELDVKCLTNVHVENENSKLKGKLETFRHSKQSLKLLPVGKQKVVDTKHLKKEIRKENGNVTPSAIKHSQKQGSPKKDGNNKLHKKPKPFSFKNVTSKSASLSNLLNDKVKFPPKSSSIQTIKTVEKSQSSQCGSDVIKPSTSSNMHNNTTNTCDKLNESNPIDDLMNSFNSNTSLEEDEHLAKLLDEEERRNYELSQQQNSGLDDKEMFLLENIDWDDEDNETFANLDVDLFKSSEGSVEATTSGFDVGTVIDAGSKILTRVDNSAEFRGIYPHTRVMNEILHSTFGLKEYRPNQQEIINASLQQHDCFVLMPTGGGKSLCYQLPAILTPGVTIVISPLRALISDQVDKLNALDIPAAHLCPEMKNSGTDLVFSKLSLREPTIKLLYLTPEKITISKFVADIFQSLYQRDKLSRFVIDEAHCLSQWGHDFRPDYKQLSLLRRQYPKVPIMCLTATATDTVQKDVMNILKLKDCKTFITSFNRPNIKYEVLGKSGKSVVQDIINLIKVKFLKKSGIIYCLGRKDCEILANDLCRVNIKARPYHAGMANSKRETFQREWMNDEFHVIVATIAFGMGIDKPNVRYVIHNSLPKSVEAFYQESGRCGRDGEISYSYLFYSYADVIRLQRLMQREKMNVKCLQGHLENLQQMTSFCENKVDCRRYLQLIHLGETFDRKLCMQNKETACDNCENVDNCEEMDVTKECKELAKLIQDLTKRDNVTMVQVTDIYKGSKRKLILEKQYDKHPYHGNGEHHDKVDIQRFLKQMIFEKILENICMNTGDFPVVYLKVGPKYGELFNTNKRISISVNKNQPLQPRPSTSKAKTTTTKTDETPSTSIIPEDQVNKLKIQCHEELLEVCRNFAVQRQVTLSSIMNLSAISVMAKLLPNTKEDFMKIQYVTNANYDKFGAEFLAVTQKYRLLLSKMEVNHKSSHINENSEEEWKGKSSQSQRTKGTKRRKYRKYRNYSKKRKKGN